VTGGTIEVIIEVIIDVPAPMLPLPPARAALEVSNCAMAARDAFATAW